MDNEKNVPFCVYESAVDSHERVKKWLITAIVVLSILFAATNGFWIYEWTRFDTVAYSYSQDGEGTNVIGTGNDISYGTTSDRQSENSQD